jgi:hypothetical protein
MKIYLPRIVFTLTIVVVPLLARAQFLITPIVTSSTPVPGGFGNFKAFTAQEGTDPIAPSLDGTSMVFSGLDDAGRGGVYRWDSGVISMVANRNTPVPNQSASFEILGGGAISGPQVAFRASTPTASGIYLANGSQITTIAETSSTFTGFSRHSIADGQIAFGATANGANSFFRYRDGTTSQVATGYQSAGNSHISRGGHIAFQAITSGSLRGVYSLDANNVLSTVADTNTTAPGGSGKFTGFNSGWIASDGPDVAFAGFSPGRTGIFARINGTLQSIAVNGQAAPNGQTFFFDAYEPEISLDNKHLAFLAVTGTNINTARGAIFTDYRNRIERVIGHGDLLGGKIIERLEMSPDALSGSNLVFTVRFTDASTAIYMARVPEPSSLATLLLLPLIMRRSRPKRLSI